MAFDHHGDILHYRVSEKGIANTPESKNWNASLFGNIRNFLISGKPIELVTYPRFVNMPNGDLLYECRIGTSGSGDSYLWQYKAASGMWSEIGKYIDGISLDPDQNAYINGIHYDKNGRLHTSWVWRQTPNAVTNHDVYYAFSDDNGFTWKNDKNQIIGRANSDVMSLESSGLKIISIAQNRGLINQESQVVDSKGGIHILQSYMLNTEPDNSSNFWASRDKAYLRHIYKDENGIWQNDIIPAISRNRSQIAIDKFDNLYVIAPDYRIYFASAQNKWKKWTALDISADKSMINEGLIDREALVENHILSFVFSQMQNKIIVPYYLLENLQKGNGTGLRAAYYNDTIFSNLAYQNLDSINYQWTGKRAFSGVSLENFSTEWSGSLETQFAEAYSIYINTSAKIKVWINDILVISGEGSTTQEYEYELPILPTHQYKIKIAAVFKEQPATIELWWKSASQEKSIIPKSQLHADNEILPTYKTANIELKKGWNLVTIPFNMPSKNIDEFFPNAIEIKTMDTYFNKMNLLFLQSLQKSESGVAYLIKNNIDETIQISGSLLNLSNSIQLKKRWNLFPYSLVSAQKAIDLFAENWDNVEKIRSFDNQYIKGSTNNANTFTLIPTKAYYIYCNKDFIFNW
ncbi:MAG: BNR repeat-containing protein [Bacteroidales bacterium]|nr:BNR repeat-containing protein [Bacteroidales bacterium]